MATATTGNNDKFGDLRRRLVFLLLALVVYRVGAHIPVPGIDPNQLQQLGAAEVDMLTLKAAGLVASIARVVKVVKFGELTTAVKLNGIGATAGAKAAIEAAGGSVA